MDSRTYEELPRDVRADLPRDAVTFDSSVPRGHVDVHSQAGVTRMPVYAFIRARRKMRKAERRNRQAGRR